MSAKELNEAIEKKLYLFNNYFYLFNMFITYIIYKINYII